MWCGIVAIVLWAIEHIYNPFAEFERYRSPDYGKFGVGTLLIGLIVGGLILSFKDKKVVNQKQE